MSPSRQSASLLAGLFLAALAPAALGQAANVKSLRITQNAPVALQVAEVIASQNGTGTNVAASANGGAATATSEAFGTHAFYANDGNTNGNYASNSLYHSSDTTGQGEYLTVTFATSATIDS